jgi:hypothetical protein
MAASSKLIQKLFEFHHGFLTVMDVHLLSRVSSTMLTVAALHAGHVLEASHPDVFRLFFPRESEELDALLRPGLDDHEWLTEENLDLLLNAEAEKGNMGNNFICWDIMDAMVNALPEAVARQTVALPPAVWDEKLCIGQRLQVFLKAFREDLIGSGHYTLVGMVLHQQHFCVLVCKAADRRDGIPVDGFDSLNKRAKLGWAFKQLELLVKSAFSLLNDTPLGVDLGAHDEQSIRDACEDNLQVFECWLNFRLGYPADLDINDIFLSPRYMKMQQQTHVECMFQAVEAARFAMARTRVMKKQTFSVRTSGRRALETLLFARLDKINMISPATFQFLTHWIGVDMEEHKSSRPAPRPVPKMPTPEPKIMIVADEKVTHARNVKSEQDRAEAAHLLKHWPKPNVSDSDSSTESDDGVPEEWSNLKRFLLSKGVLVPNGFISTGLQGKRQDVQVRAFDILPGFLWSLSKNCVVVCVAGLRIGSRARSLWLVSVQRDEIPEPAAKLHIFRITENSMAGFPDTVPGELSDEEKRAILDHINRLKSGQVKLGGLIKEQKVTRLPRRRYGCMGCCAFLSVQMQITYVCVCVADPLATKSNASP